MKRNLRIRILATALSLLTIYAVVELYCPQNLFGLCINSSPSLPHHLFRSKPLQKNLSKGVFVKFSHPASAIPLVKQIAGLPGDEVRILNQCVYVNDIPSGELKTHSKSGKEFSPTPEGEIPAGQCFVSSPHPDSFDSRYAEFGLVQIDDLEEELCPIF